MPHSKRFLELVDTERKLARGHEYRDAAIVRKQLAKLEGPEIAKVSTPQKSGWREIWKGEQIAPIYFVWPRCSCGTCNACGHALNSLHVK